MDWSGSWRGGVIPFASSTMQSNMFTKGKVLELKISVATVLIDNKATK